jgi:hypothetical protein
VLGLQQVEVMPRNNQVPRGIVLSVVGRRLRVAIRPFFVF